MDRSKNKSGDLELLRSIGFGPESVLMNESRILGDAPLLKSLQDELHEKLGADLARHILLQIGFYHGLRDSLRALSVSRGDCIAGTLPLPSTPAISLRLHGATRNAGIEIHGTWYDAAEARAPGVEGRAPSRCTMTSGYTSGWLSGLFDGSMVALEAECRNAGSNRCRFVARLAETWRARGDCAELALVDALPFELFRRTIETSGTTSHPASSDETIEASHAVHVWGPVMVVPFREPDEAVRTAETLEERGDHNDIRVVVIDFETARIDPRRDLGSLESLLRRVESWGAESVLANFPDKIESILPRLATGLLLTRSTRAEAIASAFQIVDAQKHLL